MVFLAWVFYHGNAVDDRAITIIRTFLCTKNMANKWNSSRSKIIEPDLRESQNGRKAGNYQLDRPVHQDSRTRRQHDGQSTNSHRPHKAKDNLNQRQHSREIHRDRFSDRGFYNYEGRRVYHGDRREAFHVGRPPSRKNRGYQNRVERELFSSPHPREKRSFSSDRWHRGDPRRNYDYERQPNQSTPRRTEDRSFKERSMTREGPSHDIDSRDHEFDKSSSRDHKRGYLEDCVPHQSKRSKHFKYGYGGYYRNGRSQESTVSFPKEDRHSIHQSTKHQHYAREKHQSYAPRGGRP